MATEAGKVCCIISRCKLPFGGIMNRGVTVSEETHICDANAGRKLTCLGAPRVVPRPKELL